MKSCEELIFEGVKKLTPQQWSQFKEWRESAGKPSAEQQCHYLEKVLKENLSNRESTRIVKNNGRADNGGQEFRESVGNNTDGKRTILSEAHELCKLYQKHHHLSEADARKVVGLPSKDRKDYPAVEDGEWRLFEKLCVAGRPEHEAFCVATGKTLPK